MSKQAIVLAGFLVLVFIVGAWFLGNYNNLVQGKVAVEKSWSKVETQYQRRLDLIGNLVESVKGGQKQEVAVFGKIADARSRYNGATTSGDKAQIASEIETNIALLPRLQEAYPELKSNILVQSLMSDLKGTEGDILSARNTYNDTVSSFNVMVQRFPTNLFASMFGFKVQPLFKADTGAEKSVKVTF